MTDKKRGTHMRAAFFVILKLTVNEFGCLGNIRLQEIKEYYQAGYANSKSDQYELYYIIL